MTTNEDSTKVLIWCAIYVLGAVSGLWACYLERNNEKKVDSQDSDTANISVPIYEHEPISYHGKYLLEHRPDLTPPWSVYPLINLLTTDTESFSCFTKAEALVLIDQLNRIDPTE